MSGHIEHIGSAPRLAEDVAAEVPDFPPGTRAKALLASSCVPNVTGRLFFGVTVLTPSRFFSAGDTQGFRLPALF